MENSVGSGDITVRRTQRGVDPSPHLKNPRKEPFETVLHNIGNKEQTTATSKESSGWTVYTIKPGDTLWDLAVKRSHVSVDDLIKDNQIKDPGKLQPGKQIRVRMPAPVQETLAMSRDEDNDQAGSMATDSFSQGAILHGFL